MIQRRRGTLAFKSLVFVLVAFAGGVSQAQSTEGSSGARSPSIVRALIQYALEHSPLIDSAQKRKAIRDWEHKNQVYRLLPSLDFSASHGLQNSIEIGQSSTFLTPNPVAPWYSALEVGLRETLYDNGQTLTRIKMTSVLEESAELVYLQVRDQVSLSVIKSYFQYSLAQSLSDFREEQAKVLNRQLLWMERQYKEGFKRRVDYLRMQSQIKRSEIGIISSRNEIRQALAELRKHLGLDPSSEETLPISLTPMEVDSFPVELPSEEPLLKNTYESRLAELNREVYRSEVRLAERRYWPQVTLAGALSYSNVNYLNSGQPFEDTGQLNWRALLSIRYTILDWGIQRRELAVARHTQAIQNNDLRQNLLDTDNRIVSLMSAIERLKSNYSLNRELLEIEKEAYADLERRYREGKVSYLDLVTSLQDLLNARMEYASSFFQTLSALAEYRYYEGKLYEEMVEGL